MDWHEYVTGELIEERLADLRAEAALERQLAACRLPRPPLRVAIGGALIRLGSRIVGAEPAEPLKASYRRA
jgi:hypothetical protein